eukprot:CAMPEP_0202892178 /NCGR_PEP_ID=MMETSP1392-20130828/1972_1 /ASSEMBLY_ACC=CAM_ASM_000868 /TAXON_ID=225041 /ORGANISM="Chlamydomonas chlamydogama, Strain SAG 11-48b" /LENGTH=261 /DNA_ID=CAMNT_0049576065 /DNA_START=372 /DNA_END=1154 /DNA_ORIENTATION=+
MATPAERDAADRLKTEGNTLFSKGKWSAAIERYTEAITLAPSIPVLFVNRAMAHKKREDWQRVMEDATVALQLDKDLMKAHYLLGLAHKQQGTNLEATKHLQKALEAARKADDAIKDEIWRELAKAKYAQWEQDSTTRRAQLKQLKALVDAQLAAHNGDLMEVDGPKASLSTQLQALFDSAAKMDTPTEVPSVFVCPLTMEVFREPALTPSGQSYERSVLMEHLKKCKWDPVTRKSMSEVDVMPNHGLRAAVQQYLDEHPW